MKALSKDVKHRYVTAAEMGRDLGTKDLTSIAAFPKSPASTSLVVLQGPRQGQRIRLAKRSQALGRLEPGSSNTAISRHHADIILRGDGYWLRDLTRNGTWVDHQRVFGEISLRPGL